MKKKILFVMLLMLVFMFTFVFLIENLKKFFIHSLDNL